MQNLLEWEPLTKDTERYCAENIGYTFVCSD